MAAAFVQPTPEQVAEREKAMDLGLVYIPKGAEEEEEDDEGPLGTAGFEVKEKTLQEMGEFRHNIETKLARRNMTCCFLLSIPMVIATTWATLFILTPALFINPVPLPRSYVNFLGFNVIYNTQSNGPLLDSVGAAFGVALPFYLAMFVSCGSAYWRFRRIQLRDTDIPLWTDRDTRTIQLKAARLLCFVIGIGLWFGVVQPSQRPKLRNSSFWYGCKATPIYTVTIPSDYALHAKPREIDGNRLDSKCANRFFRSVRADEEKYRGMVPDLGTDNNPEPNGTMMVYSEPVGRSRFCPKVRSDKAQTLATQALRECKEGEGWEISNWATIAQDGECHPGRHLQWYEATLTPNDVPHFVEQWFCRLNSTDLGHEVKVSYETVSWRREISGTCYDPDRGDPSWLAPLEPGSVTVRPEYVQHDLSTLSTSEVRSLFGHSRYDELQECLQLRVACMNDSYVPFEVGRDGNPIPRFWRAVSLHNCSHTLPRSPSVPTDASTLISYLMEIKSAYQVAVIAVIVEVVWDTLELIFWPCAFS